MTVVHYRPSNSIAGTAFPALLNGAKGFLEWLHLQKNCFVDITHSVVTLT